MIGKKINQLATELAPQSTDLTIIGDPISGVSKKITLAQLGAIFSGAVSFYDNLASFPVSGDINVIYCAKDTQKLYLWSGSAYTEVFPSQALLNTYQLRSEKGNANGYASLDSLGKVPISQLPSSIMEYKGTWNAATNTPTLANGTGDTGDVYICNVAGTVNFGAGPLTFAVGDYVIYSGTIWQRSSGAVGTVTSVAASITGNSVSISGSPIVTAGTLAFAFAGNTTQYVRGDGQLATLPTNGGGGGASVSYYLNGSINQGTIGGVTYYEMNKTPIIGAGTDFTRNSNGYIASFLTDANDPALLNIPAGNFNFETYFEASSGGGSPTFYIELYKYDGTNFTLIASNSTSPKLINDATNIEAYFSALAVPQTTLTLTDRLAIRIYVTTAGRTITLHTENGHLCQVITTFTTGLTALNGLTAQVQYLATGTSGTDFNIASASATHTFNLPTASATNRGALSSADWTTFNNKQNSLTLTTTGSSGDATLVGATLNIPNYTLAGLGGVPTSRTLTINGTAFDLSADRSWSVGTVTSVAALTIGTSGTDLSSTVANGTTTPVITLNVPTASATNRGALSSTDWTTFNNKQNALTNPVTGTGTNNYIPKFTTTGSTIGNSAIVDNSGNIGIGTTTTRNISGYTFTAINGTTGAYLDLYSNGNIAGSIGSESSSFVITSQNSNGISFLTPLNSYSTKMFLNNSGNLGLGVTPSAWSSSYRAFQFGATGVLWANATGTDWYLGNNEIYNSSNQLVYLTNGRATEYFQFDGKHIWNTAPSGTAGNAISFTQAMTLGSNSGLSIGTTTAAAANGLLVAGVANFSNSVTANYGGTFVIPVESPASGNVALIARTSNGGNDIFRWFDGATQLGVFKNSGNVGIGTTNPTDRLHVNGKSRATAGYISDAGSISIASGATANIIDMSTLQVNGSLQVGVFVGGGGVIYLAEAIFISNWDNGQYLKALDIYDGANVTLSLFGSNIRITNNGFGTFTWNWSYLLQPFA